MKTAIEWKAIFDDKARSLYPASDPSHDYLHIRRVVGMAEKLAREEGADLNVVLPAAYFHDFINVPKNDPRRREASRISAAAAVEYLRSVNYPEEHLEAVRHAVAAHSFSANIAPETIEEKVVQDADRLDGLGAIGIARCFSTSTLMQRPYYCLNDAFAESRPLSDADFAIDHFEVKLFKTAQTMQTAAAREEAGRRVLVMREYLDALKREIAA